MDARFWVDDFGYVWVGPCAGGLGCRFVRFEGTLSDPLAASPLGAGRWQWRSWDLPEGSEEISLARFLAFLRRHNCADYGAFSAPA